MGKPEEIMQERKSRHHCVKCRMEGKCNTMRYFVITQKGGTETGYYACDICKRTVWTEEKMQRDIEEIKRVLPEHLLEK